MDPTLNHIIPNDSFGELPVPQVQVDLNMYSNPHQNGHEYVSKITQYSSGTLEPLYCAKTLRHAVREAKKGYAKFNTDQWLRVRKDANPFDLPGDSIFINRAAVKLADLDAIYNLTPTVVSEVPVREKWSFADIAGGPGSFSQYLMFRVPNSVGFGITLADESDTTLGWDTNIAKQINVIVGDDGRGDIIKHAVYFAKKVYELNGAGVDFAVADGAVGSNEEDPRQEADNYNLILAEFYAILLCLKEGGNFVCKIFDAESKPMAQLLFLMSACFEYFDVMKPIASRPANSERYVVGLNKRPTTFHTVEILASVMNVIRKRPDIKIANIMYPKVPDDFGQWLTSKNNSHLEWQMMAAKFIEDVSVKKITVPKYNMYKAYDLWRIPDSEDNTYKAVISKQRYKHGSVTVDEIDNMLYKELTRLKIMRSMVQNVASTVSTFCDRGKAVNEKVATSFMSMYIIDHLGDDKHHPLDPVIPSSNFHSDSRYYDYLMHVTDGAVNGKQSESWFRTLAIRKLCAEKATILSNLSPSKLSYEVVKIITDKGVRYTHVVGNRKEGGYTITEIMDRKLRSLLLPEYADKADKIIYLLLMRYMGVLNSGNHQLGIPDYQHIKDIFNLKEELFASPLNKSLPIYHSAFLDTDRFFGSLGPFQNLVPEAGASYSANPPYTDILMELAMQKIVGWLNTTSNILFYITIPIWDKEGQAGVGIPVDKYLYGDYPALKVLKNSGYIKALRAYRRDNFYYHDHMSGKEVPAANTYIIIAANRELTQPEQEYIDTR